MEGVSLEENQWEIKFHQVIIGNKGVQINYIIYIYISKEAGLFQIPNDDVFLIEGAADILRDVC